MASASVAGRAAPLKVTRSATVKSIRSSRRNATSSRFARSAASSRFASTQVRSQAGVCSRCAAVRLGPACCAWTTRSGCRSRIRLDTARMISCAAMLGRSSSAWIISARTLCSSLRRSSSGLKAFSIEVRNLFTAPA